MILLVKTKMTKITFCLCTFHNTHNHNIRLNRQKKLTVRGEEGGVNPYGQPDRKKTVFYSPKISDKFGESCFCLRLLPRIGG